MLQNMRDNLKSFGLVIVAIISIPFIFTGVDQFFTDGSSSEPTVTEVNGVAITAADLSREMNQVASAMGFQGSLQQLEENVQKIFQQQALSSLVSKIAVQTAASEQGMAVARETINEEIRSIPAFQRDGVFDKDLYYDVLDRAGFTSSAFTGTMQRNMLGNQFVQGLLNSEFVSDIEVGQSAAVAEQLRDFYYLTIALQPLLDTLQIDDKDVQAHYEESKGQLLVPEQVVVEYIELSMEALIASQQVTDVQVRERFESEQQDTRNNADQQRRLAHILINTGSDDEQQKLAAEIKSKLDAGEDFAALAKAHSQDAGTANIGGDLGFIDLEVLPAELSEAAVSMEYGSVSAPVKTDQGYHLLKIQQTTFEEQQQRIANNIKREQAESQFAVLLPRLEELSFDILSDGSLQTVADELNLEMKLSESFPRAGGTGIAAETAVASAAYSDSVYKDGNSSDIQQLIPGERAVVVKLHEKIAERTKALAEVRDQLIDDLKQEQAREQIQIRGEALLARVVAGESIEEVAKAEQLEWQVSLKTKRAGGNVDGAARNKAFELPAPTDRRQVSGLVNGNGDYLLVHLTAVNYPADETLTDGQRQSIAVSLEQSSAKRALGTYQRRLVEEAEVN